MSREERRRLWLSKGRSHEEGGVRGDRISWLEDNQDSLERQWTILDMIYGRILFTKGRTTVLFHFFGSKKVPERENAIIGLFIPSKDRKMEFDSQPWTILSISYFIFTQHFPYSNLSLDTITLLFSETLVREVDTIETWRYQSSFQCREKVEK